MKKIILISLIFVTACKAPAILEVENKQVVPSAFNQNTDSSNIANIQWRNFFEDKNLATLIDTAIKNNYELLSNLQDIEITKNNIRIRHADLLPRVSSAVGLGLEKTARYTAAGAGNASTEIIDGKEVPEPISDIFLGFHASWEADVWGKLHKAKKVAVIKYLQTIEGRNFLITNLVAEVANSYYELLALDNQLDIIQQAIELQKNELEVVKVQKEAAKATELAVKQFEAQVYNSQSQLFDVQQRIVETENKINFLLGRFPQPIARDKKVFSTYRLKNMQIGLPAQLLQNRPDIKQAEMELQAAKLDVQIARAEFYPSVGFGSTLGLQAFKPKYLVSGIEGLAFSLVGEMAAPLINKNAIIAEFNKASANQIAALYDYQKTILSSYLEVANQVSNMDNLEKFYTTKSKESETLAQSIEVARDLFKSARANYLEILMVQRDALSAKLELIEARKKQFITTTNIYKALGGGWK